MGIWTKGENITKHGTAILAKMQNGHERECQNGQNELFADGQNGQMEMTPGVLPSIRTLDET